MSKAMLAIHTPPWPPPTLPLHVSWCKHTCLPFRFTRSKSNMIGGRLRQHIAAGREEATSDEEFLLAFTYESKCKQGKRMNVKMLNKPQQLAPTIAILVDSFAELVLGPFTYRPLLEIIVRENLVATQKLFPRNVVLVATYCAGEDNLSSVVGTAELYLSTSSNSIDKPSPPKGAAYLCNMAVHSSLRRRGIGRAMLKAAEDLARTVGRTELYLHCRLVDIVPFAFYCSLGYQVTATSGMIASLLMLQRRRHLMRKQLLIS